MQRIFIILFIFILTPALSALAEPRYVTDQIVIGLRPAQNDTSPPLEYLTTGTRIEVVEDLGAFLKIKSSAGAIGFARSKYFLLTPPAGASAATDVLQGQLATTLKRNIELAAELLQLQSAPTVANTIQPQELAKSQKDLAELSKRYQELKEIQGGTTAIIQERDELRQEVLRLKGTDKDNTLSSALSGGSELQWFFAGAAILLVGWFAGKSTRSKRRF